MKRKNLENERPKKRTKTDEDLHPSHNAMVKQKDLFSQLPYEIQERILSFLGPHLGALRLTSKFHKEVVEGFSRRIFTRPDFVINFMSGLSAKQKQKFINVCKNLFADQYKARSPNPYVIICYALTTTDINQIKSVDLKEALEKTQDSLPANIAASIAKVCKVLSITEKYKNNRPNQLIEDLKLQNLEDTNLSGANLSFYLFQESMWNGANLRGANLEGSKFDWVSLTDVNFQHTNLKNSQIIFLSQSASVNFIDADQTGAKIIHDFAEDDDKKSGPHA